MQAYGADRVRASGGKVILHSRLAKGWTARTPKTVTRSEFPGTAVLWDDRYFEVLSAEPLPAGGVRYVLGDWQEEHTFRTVAAYDAESEARLLADYETAARQQQRSRFARWSGMVLGHLPAAVQNRLADELGLFPARMTLLSLIPSLLFFAACVWLYVDAKVAQTPSPVAAWVWAIAFFLLLDSAVRFMIAMSQNRGTGSLPGLIVYAAIWLLTPKRRNLVAPFEASRGEKLFTLPPSEEVAQRDSVEWRSWMFTLLPPNEQRALAQRYDYDYRKDAYTIAGALLAVGVIGIIASVPKLDRVSGLASLIVASLIVVEQVIRLIRFKTGPAGSILAMLVRPFIRDLLLRQPPIDDTSKTDWP
jgi:hypothetical protein